MELKIKIASAFIFVLLSSSSCAMLSDPSGQRFFDDSVEELDAIKSGLDQFVGKHKNELQKEMGRPKKIVSPSNWDNVQYDEEWIYTRGIPLINRQYRMFYIKDDVVLHTEFGGIF